MTWWTSRDERLKDEIEAHIEFAVQENIKAGLPPEEARRDAMRKFGNVLLTRERSREMWGWLWLEQLWQDIRYALRGFARNPGFATVALLSLMLGIGTSVALFSVIYGILIAPYPYAKPNEIWAPAVVAPNYPMHAWHRYTRREYLEIQKLSAFSDVMGHRCASGADDGRYRNREFLWSIPYRRSLQFYRSQTADRSDHPTL